MSGLAMITNLREVTEHDRTFHRCTISVDGESWECHDRHGSWSAQTGPGREAHVTPFYAAQLQHAARRYDRDRLVTA